MRLRLFTMKQRLETTEKGLTSAEATPRLDRDGPNVLGPRKRAGELILLLGQFKSPLICLAALGAVVVL